MVCAGPGETDQAAHPEAIHETQTVSFAISFAEPLSEPFCVVFADAVVHGQKSLLVSGTRTLASLHH